MQSLASEIQADVYTIDLALATIADEAERQYHAGEIDQAVFNGFIGQQLTRLPEVDGLWVSGADGKVAYGRGSAKAHNALLANDHYYAMLRSAGHPGQLLSKPVIDRASGQSQLVLGRRINYADGTFAGIVYAHKGSAHFTRKFAALDIGEKGIVTLFDDDFTILAPYSAPASAIRAIGAHIGSPPLRAAVASSKDNATLLSVSNTDGVERVISYRRIDNTPLHLLVGMSTQTYLARWKKESAITSVFFFVFLSFSLSILMY